MSGARVLTLYFSSFCSTFKPACPLIESMRFAFRWSILSSQALATRPSWSQLQPSLVYSLASATASRPTRACTEKQRDFTLKCSTRCGLSLVSSSSSPAIFASCTQSRFGWVNCKNDRSEPKIKTSIPASVIAEAFYRLSQRASNRTAKEGEPIGHNDDSHDNDVSDFLGSKHDAIPWSSYCVEWRWWTWVSSIYLWK